MDRVTDPAADFQKLREQSSEPSFAYDYANEDMHQVDKFDRGGPQPDMIEFEQGPTHSDTAPSSAGMFESVVYFCSYLIQKNSDFWEPVSFLCIFESTITLQVGPSLKHMHPHASIRIKQVFLWRMRCGMAQA